MSVMYLVVLTPKRSIVLHYMSTANQLKLIKRLECNDCGVKITTSNDLQILLRHEPVWQIRKHASN
jgi:hypothetical protein